MILEYLDDFLTRHNISTELGKNDAYALFVGLREEQLNIHNGPWVAGGSVLAMLDQRGLIGRDVDFFFASNHQMDTFEKQIKDRIEIKSSITTGNATTFVTRFETLQFIFRDFYKNTDELTDSFDFSVCKFVTDGTWLAYTQQAYDDWVSKTLRFESDHKEVNTIDRFLKYSNNGYTTDHPTLKKMFDWLENDSGFFSASSTGY